MLQKHLGVRYTYREEEITQEQDGPAEQSVSDMAVLAALPSNLLSALHQAVTLGDIDELEGLIEQIRQYDNALADALMTLAADFRYDQFFELLNHMEACNG
jgi:transketolase C-terminal domain/subunit